MNFFDILYGCLLIFFLFRGFTKGFFRSIIGPLCFFFWSIIGIINYDLEGNIITAIMVTLTGGFICTFLVLLLFSLGKIQVHEQHRHYLLWPSRVLGSGVNAVWNGLLVAVLTVMVSLMPQGFIGMGKPQEQIKHSCSYAFFYRHLIDPFPDINNIQMTIAVLNDHSRLEFFKDTPQYQAVFSDKKVIIVLNNSYIMTKIYSKDAITLLQTNEIQQILNDKRLMTKFSELGKIVYREQRQAGIK